MNNSFKIIFIVFLIIYFPIYKPVLAQSFAQTSHTENSNLNDTKDSLAKRFCKHNIFLEVLGEGFIGSFNYEAIFPLNNQNYFGARIGILPISFDFIHFETILPLCINYILPLSKKVTSLEFGIGMTLDTDGQSALVLINFNSGFRFQFTKHFFGKINFTPIIKQYPPDMFLPDRVIPWGGFSIGYSFNKVQFNPKHVVFKIPRNSVFIELLGSGGAMSINYERTFSIYRNHGYTSRIGGFYFHSKQKYGLKLFTIPFLLNYTLNINKSLAFEIGGGCRFVKYGLDKRSGWGLIGNSGIRINFLRNTFIKINYTPQFYSFNKHLNIIGPSLSNGYKNWFGMSFGYSF